MTPEERARQLIVILGIATDSGPRERDVADIALAIREAVAEERERWARWHDKQAVWWATQMTKQQKSWNEHVTDRTMFHRGCAHSIRSLPDKDKP